MVNEAPSLVSEWMEKGNLRQYMSKEKLSMTRRGELVRMLILYQAKKKSLMDDNLLQQALGAAAWPIFTKCVLSMETLRV